MPHLKRSMAPPHGLCAAFPALLLWKDKPSLLELPRTVCRTVANSLAKIYHHASGFAIMPVPQYNQLLGHHSRMWLAIHIRHDIIWPTYTLLSQLSLLWLSWHDTLHSHNLPHTIQWAPAHIKGHQYWHDTLDNLSVLERLCRNGPNHKTYTANTQAPSPILLHLPRTMVLFGTERKKYLNGSNLPLWHSSQKNMMMMTDWH